MLPAFLPFCEHGGEWFGGSLGIEYLSRLEVRQPGLKLREGVCVVLELIVDHVPSRRLHCLQISTHIYTLAPSVMVLFVGICK